MVINKFFSIDRYYECNIKGEEKMKLCDDGLVYDIASQHCDYPAKVNCTGRPDLRESIDFLVPCKGHRI